MKLKYRKLTDAAASRLLSENDFLHVRYSGEALKTPKGWVRWDARVQTFVLVERGTDAK